MKWLDVLGIPLSYNPSLTDYKDKVKINAAWHKEAQVVRGSRSSKLFIYAMFAKQCQQAKNFLTL